MTKNRKSGFAFDFFPFVFHRAPVSFVEKAQRGAARMPRVFSGPWMTRLKTPAKDEERRATR
jgi:hypothetical protein